MTFSDAEEDQPSGSQAGAMSNRLSAGNKKSNSTTASDNQEGSSEVTRTEESSLSSLPNGTASSSEITFAANVNGSLSPPPIQGSSNESQLNLIPHSQQNGSIACTSESEESISNSVVPSQPTSQVVSTETMASAEDSEKGLETEKVMEKLQQIHGYIQQTSSAMQSLENEGNLNKIGQYNTLVKCMRELKKTEEKLTSHLDKLKIKPSQSERGNSQPASGNASETTQSGKVSGTSSGSSSLGVVGNLNEDGRHLSMQDGLARHENEQAQLSERLRDSLVRRQELMARYQATRERLNNLKRQRQGLVHEERRLLQSVGAPENPYDDPIPGSDTWTIEQLESAIRDFEGLRTKVENLHQVYLTKLQAVEEEDSEARADLERKIEQIHNKKRQIANALMQMTELLQVKTERAQAGDNPELETSPNASQNENPNPLVPPGNGNQSTFETSPGEAPEPLPEGLEFEGAVGISAEAANLEEKQQHLQSLKNQLSAMKKLLHVPHTMLPSASTNEGEEAQTEQDSLNGRIYECGEEREEEHPQEEEALADSKIVGVNGDVIHLSETERRNPHVASKFKELTLAKQRLAKMEEIMEKIAEARQSGQALTEVLSPENMAILDKAREEEGIIDECPSVLPNLNEPRGASLSSDRNVLNEILLQRQVSPRDPILVSEPSNKNQVNQNQERSSPGDGRHTWQREQEISAMHYHLKKKTPQIPPINEGSMAGREKGALKKQNRNLLNESGGDPRLMEVITLQEELKEKKNALEALMRRMGKSSSFNLGNISDNISENVSEDANSDTTDKMPSASWGLQRPRGGRHTFQEHSGPEEDEEVDDLEDGIENEMFGRSVFAGIAQTMLGDSARQSQSLPRSSAQPQNRNPLSSPKLQQQPLPRRNPEPPSRVFSVNNLSTGSIPKSVRPKHNRYPERNVPATSWEHFTGGNVNSGPTPSSSKVQNTVAAALSQLAQVQDTINSLYSELRTAEMTGRQPEIPLVNPFSTNVLIPPQPAFTTPSVTQNLFPAYALSSLPNIQGRADLGASNHVLAGLQQCFSQLYLHSLEIQSLSKHLQIIEQREQTLSPHQRGEQPIGSAERRGERAPAPRRREDETAKQNFRIRRNPNFDVSNLDDIKTDASYLNRDEYFLNPQTNENHSFADVTNPLYVRLCNAQGHSLPSWQQVDAREEVDLELVKNLSPYDGSASDGVRPPSNAEVDILLGASSHFPFEAEDMNEDLPWTTVSSPQTHQPSSSDLLNNQVLPGSRANNYWDNFRSYSRQNPLSTTAKSNTGDQVSQSGSSTPGRTQGFNTASAQMQHSVGFEVKNRPFGLSPHPNNSINKASDKNSIATRRQNKGGARARYPPHEANAHTPHVANSLCERNVSSSGHQQSSSDSCKRNNRHDYRIPYELDGIGQHEARPNLSVPFGDELLINAISSPPRFNNSRRYVRERESPLPRNAQEGDNDAGVGHEANLRRMNALSVDDEPNTFDTFNRVVKEAESLMQRHSQQPHFLLQLFHHASKISSNTDQQVALELLKELSYQRQQNNIQQNRWTSNSSVAQSGNFSLPSETRESNYRNLATLSNKTSRTRGISGSEASESEITSDDEDTKVRNEVAKNLTPISPGVAISLPFGSSAQAFAGPSNNPCSPAYSSIAGAQNQQGLSDSHKDLPKDNIAELSSKKEQDKSQNQQRGIRLARKREETDTPQLRNYIASNASCDSPSAHTNSLTLPSAKSNSKPFSFSLQHTPITDKANNRRQTRKSPRRNLAKSIDDKFRLSSKMAKNVSRAPSGPANDLVQEPVSGFEAIVSASLREVLLCFESVDCTLISTVQILDNLHFSIMKQVHSRSSTLGFSCNFVSSIDSQLKATFRGFSGKTLPALRQELAAAVTQVLIQEYCSSFTQQDNLPSEPRQNQAQEPNLANELSLANRSECELPRKPIPSQFGKQASSHSLFSPQETSLTSRSAAKSANAAWTLGPSIAAEGPRANRERPELPNLMTFARDEEFKNDPCISKGKGAISKKPTEVPSHLEGSSDPTPLELSGCLLGQSPHPEASSFPESWVVQRGGSTARESDSLYTFGDSSLGVEREERGFLNNRDAPQLEHNDAEADQAEHTRNLDSSSLPVHDLAEADQSQDPIKADSVESAVENERYEASASPPFVPPLQEPKEFTLRFLTKKKTSNKDIPEHGLDEVPTRLMSAAEGSFSPQVNLSGRSSVAEGTDERIPPHRYGAFSSPQNPSISPPPNELNVSHHSHSSSGKGD